MASGAIGPYRIVGDLGAGGMGKVFLAEDTRLRRLVALKTVRGEDEPGSRRQLLREARAAARLNHPNIAAVYDVLEDGPRVHIVIEYVRGESLAARIDRGALPPGEAIAIGLQLCDALSAAHAEGVVHRDLKPGNVALTQDGRAKVLDFGLAHGRVLDDSSAGFTPLDDDSGERLVVGTPAYIAPEQLQGAAGDARSDIYSLGVTLFEMLTGRRPFDAADVGTLFDAVLNSPAPRLRQLRPGLPEDLERIVARAIARDPALRHASAADLRAELAAAGRERGLPDTDVQAAPTHSELLATPGRAFSSRRAFARVFGRPVWLAAALVGCASAAFALIQSERNAAEQSARASRPQVLAVLPFSIEAERPGDEALATGIADLLVSALSRLGGVNVLSRLATLPYRDREGLPQRALRELGATQLVDGVLQRSGDSVRVTLSLVGADGVVSWSHDYEASFGDAFAVQRQAAEALTQALALRLTGRERRQIAARATWSADALANYSQARAFLERQDARGNVDRAVELLTQALRLDPRFAAAHASLGEAYWARYVQTKDARWPPLAERETSEAIRLAPDDPMVRRSLAQVLAGTGRADAAIEELRRVIALQPSDDEAHRQLGRLLARTGQLPDGLAHLQKAISARPAFWSNHFTLGFVLYQAGRYEDASRSFRRASELQPDSAWPLQMLGTSLHALGRLDEAESAYRRAIDAGSDALAYGNLATIHFTRRRFDQALALYQEAVRLDPRAPARHRNLGDCFAQLGRTAEARRAYARAAELARAELAVNPNDAGGIARLAVYEAKLGDDQAARTHAAEAARMSPESPEILYRQAVVEALTGRTDAAVESLERALRAGFAASLVREDPDLQRIVESPRVAAQLVRGGK